MIYSVYSCNTKTSRVFYMKVSRGQARTSLYQSTEHNYMNQKNISPLLENWESVVMQINKHPMTHLLTAFLSVLFIVSGVIIIVFGGSIESLIGNGLYWWWISLYSIVFLSFLIISFFSDSLDTLIITENRILLLEKTLPFGQETRIIDINDITEISSESKWILQTLFWYGTLSIGYIWGTQKIRFLCTPIPSTVIERIHEIKKNHTKNTNTVA